MRSNKYLSWVVAVGFALGLVAFIPAFAATQPAMPDGGWGGRGMHGGMMGHMVPGVFGTVSAINGATLTVTSKMRPNATSSAATAYTVDASNAQVVKNGASSTLASVATGDLVLVQGTVSGTNVAATVIRDGMGMMGGHGMSGMMDNGFVHSSSTPKAPPIQGNGEPVIGGSIVSISGTMLTVTNASNVTYTVDASSAKIVKNGTTTTLSTVATGDSVVVQGTVNGTSVTASSVIDQGSVSQAGGTTGASVPHPGFLGAIGNFFRHIFGF